jgi:hypothetical protein
MNNFNNSKPTRLSKVYFTWVIRDFGMAEWFHSLLHAIEEQDTQNRIEINIYLTANMKEDDMSNIFVRTTFQSGKLAFSETSSNRSRTLVQRKTPSHRCVLPLCLVGRTGIAFSAPSSRSILKPTLVW